MYTFAYWCFATNSTNLPVFCNLIHIHTNNTVSLSRFGMCYINVRSCVYWTECWVYVAHVARINATNVTWTVSIPFCSTVRVRTVNFEYSRDTVTLNVTGNWIRSPLVSSRLGWNIFGSCVSIKSEKKR